MDDYYRRDCLLIYCDEKAYAFGGSKGHYRITASEGTTAYSSRARNRFTLEQWAASCTGDLSISRPYFCWHIEEQNAQDMAQKLTTINNKLR